MAFGTSCALWSFQNIPLLQNSDKENFMTPLLGTQNPITFKPERSSAYDPSFLSAHSLHLKPASWCCMSRSAEQEKCLRNNTWLAKPWPVCLIRNLLLCSSMSREIPWLFFITWKKACSEIHGFWHLVTALLDLKNYPCSKFRNGRLHDSSARTKKLLTS